MREKVPLLPVTPTASSHAATRNRVPLLPVTPTASSHAATRERVTLLPVTPTASSHAAMRERVPLLPVLLWVTGGSVGSDRKGGGGRGEGWIRGEAPAHSLCCCHTHQLIVSVGRRG